MSITEDQSKIMSNAHMIVSRPFIGLMHTNRLDLLCEAIQSIKNFKGDIIVLNNSVERDVIPSIRNDETWGQSLRYVKKTVINPTQPLNYSQSMNYFRGLCISNNLPYYFVMHEDAQALEGVLDRLVDKVKIANMNRDRWGIMFTNEDSLVAINSELILEQKWDSVFPAYFADTDFYYWASKRGFDLIQTKLPVKHFNSATIKSDERLLFKNNITFDLYHEYYCRKCGGSKGVETYDIPFNSELFKLSEYING
jgi:hypothetical protein